LGSRVNVLLATYNGSRFLGEQLKSLDAQTLAPSRVTIRDDDSSDSTLPLVREWAEGKSSVILLSGPRLGAAKNFLTLLAHPDEGSDYFAFCDQDDVWLPNKIERAVEELRRHDADVPAMYCARVELVDKNLAHLGYSRTPKRVGFANALVENVATGCTVLLNRTARDLICRRLPDRMMLHDSWCYLVVSALGEVVFDERPLIKYRQHPGNHVGAPASALELFPKRVRRFLRPDGFLRRGLSDQAAEFERCFGELLSVRDKRTLNRFLCVRRGFKERAFYGAMMDVWRQSRVDTMILRALILMGRV